MFYGAIKIPTTQVTPSPPGSVPYISVAEVRSALTKVNSQRTSGPDGVSGQVLKSTSTGHILCPEKVLFSPNLHSQSTIFLNLLSPINSETNLSSMGNGKDHAEANLYS